MRDLIVVGGGIAGLSAAYYAVREHPDWRVTVLEAADRWGGKITTVRLPLDGGQFIIEGGPDTFLASKPWGVALCRQLGLEERLHGTNPRQKNTYVIHRGRLTPLPDGLAMMIPGKVRPMLTTRLLNPLQKLRLGLDFVLPVRQDEADESLGDFISRRLGRAAYENLIEPLMSGIYAGDGDRLSLLSTFPYLRDLERKYGSLARGAMTMYRQRVARGKATQGSRSAFLTPTTGLAEIVEALVAHLEAHEVDLRLHTPVHDVAQTDSGWRVNLADGTALASDALILATPAWVSAQLLQAVDADLSAALAHIPYVSTATVTLAYRLEEVPRSLDGYGYVIPRREGRQALACTWTSTKFPHRAPDGYALLRVFIGRAGQDIPWEEASLLTIARQELRHTLGIRAEPLVQRVFMWPRAMPQYNLGHQEILAQVESSLRGRPGLALAGNGYRGIGIPDCIHSGEMAVAQVAAEPVA